MIGYDTHGAQYPEEWNEKPTLNHNDLNPDGYKCHGQCDFPPCDGEIEEYTERPYGWSEKVFFRCLKCGQDVTTEIVNAGRDTSDWEFDYV